MPLHKTRPMARNTDSSGGQPAAVGATSQSQSRSPPVTDKSNRAAQMAKELASQSSWADTYAPPTPATPATPAESVAGTEPHPDELEPPPSYEASRLERDRPSIPLERSGFWRNDGVSIPPLPNRTYTRHETSSPITGIFTFYDSLDLSTLSGGINIVIDPQPSEEVGIIRLASRSGSVKVRFSEDYLKAMTASGFFDRVFDIEVRTSSGSQTVEIPQGNGGTTSLTSDTGSINVKLYTTHLAKDHRITTLSTQSATGAQNIKIKSTSSAPIASLAAEHVATGSGSIKVYLPPTWEGMVHTLSQGSGSVDVRGDDLQYQRNGSKEIYAWRLRDDGSGKPPSQGQAIEVRGEGSGTIKVDCSAS